jgi:hypothetical protein
VLQAPRYLYLSPTLRSHSCFDHVPGWPSHNESLPGTVTFCHGNTLQADNIAEHPSCALLFSPSGAIPYVPLKDFIQTRDLSRPSPSSVPTAQMPCEGRQRALASLPNLNKCVQVSCNPPVSRLPDCPPFCPQPLELALGKAH